MAPEFVARKFYNEFKESFVHLICVWVEFLRQGPSTARADAFAGANAGKKRRLAPVGMTVPDSGSAATIRDNSCGRGRILRGEETTEYGKTQRSCGHGAQRCCARTRSRQALRRARLVNVELFGLGRGFTLDDSTEQFLASRVSLGDLAIT